MNKIVLGILLVAGIGFGQTTVTIPPPTGANDSLTHPEFGDNIYSSAPIVYPAHRDTAVIVFSQNIGDFDGDGSDDIFICWFVNVQYYQKNGTKNDQGFSRYHYGVYSILKSKYLFSGLNHTGLTGNVITGDFNNDDKIDFVAGNKVYLGTATLSKKKVLP